MGGNRKRSAARPPPHKFFRSPDTNPVIKNWVDSKPRSDTAQALFEWANLHPCLDVKECMVPDSIVASSTDKRIEVSLHDIVPCIPGGKRKGPDDDLYDTFPYLRAYVPRGLTVVRIKTTTKGSKSSNGNASSTKLQSTSQQTQHPANQEANNQDAVPQQQQRTAELRVDAAEDLDAVPEPVSVDLKGDNIFVEVPVTPPQQPPHQQQQQLQPQPQPHKEVATTIKKQIIDNNNNNNNKTSNNGGTHTQYEIGIFAMKKFTGGPGDEDEEEDIQDHGMSRWQQYFLRPVSDTVRIIETSKENGDAAHMSVIRIDGRQYLLIGSKLVHMLLRPGHPEDALRYTQSAAAARYSVAAGFARELMHYLESKLLPQRRQQFFDYLCDNRLTATFEYLQLEHQHVEKFDFPESKFRFIAFTSNKLDEEVHGSLCMNPEQGVKIAREAGFETVQLSSHPYAEQNALFDKIRFKTYGKEGSVLYYLDRQDRVIGLVKKKTVWYILTRALREKMKNFATKLVNKRGLIMENTVSKAEAISNIKSKIKAAFKQKQEWLGFSNDVLHHWNMLGGRLAEWLYDRLTTGAANSKAISGGGGNIRRKLTPAEVANQFPNLVWYPFLEDTGLSDNVTTA